ncbi:uncharacterized protein LOC135347364 isoform X4 [Halichondria panicea]|uniref:uncharacterized protein LOC135347364 isoform X4 n=1 Tax=Halichondria panicea TaxID=6063 RepID=UPI00312BA067
MRLDKEKWRLRVNGFLTQILAPMMFSISGTLYLSSLHRFVTNPKKAGINETTLQQVEPGLDESETMYALLITIYSYGELTGGLLLGFLTKCIPNWYQFVFAISLHTIGYVLYGVATNGGILMIGMFLAGYYLGAQITLSMNYATEMSVEYVNLLKEVKNEKDENFEYEKKVVKTRNFLYSVYSIGFSVGLVVGPSVSVIFSNLPIEQYRSIAWFNVAFGVILLILFCFLFRGESKWNRTNCHELCVRSKNNSSSAKPGPLQIFIIVSMHLLSFVQMLKWAYFEALMNPILSDSFGFSLNTSSYVFLGVAISSILGSILLVLLQRIKISTQMGAFIGISMTIAGYFLVTDWQAIYLMIHALSTVRSIIQIAFKTTTQV